MVGGGRGRLQLDSSLGTSPVLAGHTQALCLGVYVAMATTLPTAAQPGGGGGGGARWESLTVMVLSLFCFLLGEEDPRFWGER